MQKGLATDIAFLRTIAIEQAINTIQIPLAATITYAAFLPEGTSVAPCQLNALRRIRVAGKEV
ncbi:hypothetical protein D3C80_2160150 [compost metagenome]